MVLNNEAASLESRMVHVGTKIEVATQNANQAIALKKTGEALTLIATLGSPVVEGQTLQANEVVIEKDTAYVAYNMAGAKQLGAVNIIDLSNRSKPKLISELVFTDSDVNGLAKSNDTLYITGATSSGDAPAFLRSIKLENGKLTSTVKSVNLASFAGTSVTISSDIIYVTSGNTGGVTAFKRETLSPLANVTLHDARAVRVNPMSGLVHVLSGTPGLLSLFAQGLESLHKAVTIGNGLATAESKSTLEIYQDWSLVAAGEGGSHFYCNADGSLLGSIPQVSHAGLSAEKTVTNSASMAASGGADRVSKTLFTANGEAGVYRYSVSSATPDNTCAKVTLGEAGHLNLGASFSANAVYANKELVFVAAGLGGLKIIGLSKHSEEDQD